MSQGVEHERLVEVGAERTRRNAIGLHQAQQRAEQALAAVQPDAAYAGRRGAAGRAQLGWIAALDVHHVRKPRVGRARQ